MDLQPGDCIQNEARDIDKIVHISRLTVFVAFPTKAGPDKALAFLEHQLTKVDPPQDRPTTCNSGRGAMRIALIVQGLYYLMTGLWPLFHISSFEAVTGPKTDDWLVQTVGVLAAVIGTVLLVGCRRRPSTDVIILAVLAAIGFAAVDMVFVAKGTISRIYLVDAAVQTVFLSAIVSAITKNWKVDS